MHVAASQVGRVVSDSQQAALALAMLARHGECGIRRVREAVESLPLVPASFESSFGSLLDLLPLHPVLVKDWCKKKGTQVDSCRTWRWATLVRSMADSLICLFCAGFSRTLVLPDSVRPLSRRQEAVLNHLWQSAAEFLSVPSVPFDLADQRFDLANRRVFYSGDFVCTREKICCNVVVPMWPVIGEAAVRPIIRHIEPHLSAEIASPRACLRPVEDWPTQTPRSCVFADEHEWYATIRAAF